MFRSFPMLFFACINSCQSKDNYSVESNLQQTLRQNCFLEEGSKGAGPARNIRAQCEQTYDSFQYRISWLKPEDLSVAVTMYRVLVTYETLGIPARFRQFTFYSLKYF